MSSPLTELVKAYDKRREWTLALPHLGVRGCVRHGFSKGKLPAPEIGELASRTKDPNFVCLEISCDNGALHLVPLLGPCSWPAGAKFARTLIRAGAHPLDVVVATADVSALAVGRGGDVTWTFRTSVDQMFWTHEDQAQLEAEEAL